MGEITQRWSLDTWVNESKPDRNYETYTVLQASNVVGESKRAYVYFNFAPPLGATIIEARLRLYSYSSDTTRTVQVSVAPVIARAFLSSITWNTRPDQQGMTAFAVKTGPWAGGAAWDFDVTSYLQQVSDGAAWNGFEVTALGIGGPETVVFYSADGSGYREEYRPELYVKWSDAPDTPTQLHPGQGLAVRDPKPWLRWDYTDVSGNQEMAALHVQWSDVEDFATTTWDSGEHPASLPELDMNQDMAAAGLPVFNGIPSGAAWYWRVRVKDGGPQWSDWSDPARVVYSPGGTFTLLSPTQGTPTAPAPVDNRSFLVSWSLTGATQQQYRVRVWVDEMDALIFDTGRRTGTEQALEIDPTAFLRARADLLFRVEVDVWDTEARTNVPRATAYYSDTTYALFDWDEAITPTDEIAARALDPYPFVELTWSRDPAPEAWTVVRNGEIIAQLDYADTVQPDGTHKWIDRYPPPRTELKYTARAVVDGKTAWGNVPALCVSEPVGIWLVNDDDEVCLIGDEDGTWSMGETSAVHEPISGDRVVQTRTGLRGYEGSLSGLLMSDVRGLEGVSAREWRDRLLRIKRARNPRLVLSSLSIPVILSEVVAAPTPAADEHYAASFAFWQRGPYEWGTE